MVVQLIRGVHKVLKVRQVSRVVVVVIEIEEMTGISIRAGIADEDLPNVIIALFREIQDVVTIVIDAVRIIIRWVTVL